MDLTKYTTAELLAHIDDRAFWGSLKAPAWWYNRKKALIAPGRVVVIFELFLGPGVSVILDAAGNRYPETWIAADALGIPQGDRAIVTAPHNCSLGEKTHPSDVGYNLPLRGIPASIAKAINDSFGD